MEPNETSLCEKRAYTRSEGWNRSRSCCWRTDYHRSYCSHHRRSYSCANSGSRINRWYSSKRSGRNFHCNSYGSKDNDNSHNNHKHWNDSFNSNTDGSAPTLYKGASKDESHSNTIGMIVHRIYLFGKLLKWLRLVLSVDYPIGLNMLIASSALFRANNLRKVKDCHPCSIAIILDRRKV
jgi:hypothetical protein